MADQQKQTTDIPQILSKGILFIPSIGIPYLFGMVAFKALGFVSEGVGYAFNQVKNMIPGQK